MRVVGGGPGRELMKLDARCASNSARPFGGFQPTI